MIPDLWAPTPFPHLTRPKPIGRARKTHYFGSNRSRDCHQKDQNSTDRYWKDPENSDLECYCLTLSLYLCLCLQLIDPKKVHLVTFSLRSRPLGYQEQHLGGGVNTELGQRSRDSDRDIETWEGKKESPNFLSTNSVYNTLLTSY